MSTPIVDLSHLPPVYKATAALALAGPSIDWRRGTFNFRLRGGSARGQLSAPRGTLSGKGQDNG